jgi:hypothetical protein
MHDINLLTTIYYHHTMKRSFPPSEGTTFSLCAFLQGNLQGNQQRTFSFGKLYIRCKILYGKKERAVADNSIKPSDLTGIYKDVAEVIGIESTLLLHKEFQGQQVTFPKKIYSKSYILQQILKDASVVNIKEFAVKYGYTERRLRQIIKEAREQLTK